MSHERWLIAGHFLLESTESKMEKLSEKSIIGMIREEYTKKLYRFLPEAHHEDDDEKNRDDRDDTVDDRKVPVILDDLSVGTKLTQVPAKETSDAPKSGYMYTVTAKGGSSATLMWYDESGQQQSIEVDEKTLKDEYIIN